MTGGPPTGVLDPSYNKTFELMAGLLKDLNDTFTDNMIHLGGDEVIGDCYAENPNIDQFMKDNNITAGNYDGLVVYHQNKTRALLRELNKDKVGVYWSNEATYYQTYQDNDVIVYWGLVSEFEPVKVLYKNQKIVLAPGDYYYMDCGFGNKYGSNAWCDPFKTWWTIYQFEPSALYNST